MHDPLMCRSRTRVISRGQIENDVLADPMDPVDSRAGEGFGHDLRIGLEGFLITTEPDGIDALAAYAFVHAISDGFDFRELGHRLLFSQNVAQLLPSRWRSKAWLTPTTVVSRWLFPAPPAGRAPSRLYPAASMWSHGCASFPSR